MMLIMSETKGNGYCGNVSNCSLTGETIILRSNNLQA